MPDSATVSGLHGALLATDSVPDAEPAAVGANVTLTVHDPFAAIEVPQVLVSANGPLAPTDETETAVLFGLDTVTVCAPLVDPTVWLPNDSARRRRRQRTGSDQYHRHRRRGTPRTPPAARPTSRCWR